MRFKTFKVKIIFISLLCLTALMFYFIPIDSIKEIPANIIVNKSTIQDINKNAFGKLVSPEIEGDLETSTNNTFCCKMTLKLFNVIPIKKVELRVVEDKIFASGDSVGFSLNTNGLIVIGSSKIQTENGLEDAINDNIKSNDIITEIADEEVKNVSDISKIINKEENAGKTLKVKLIRNNEEIETTITPKLELLSKQYKLGIWVKEEASGIGTLTYVNLKNNRYGALGHAICDSNTKQPFVAKSGEMYKCTIIGLTKASKGKPGEIKGLFIQGKNTIGSVDKNTPFGIFGNINLNNIKINENSLYDIGGRLTAKAGKAQILSNVDGNGIEAYDIEIIKTNYQHISNEKSMVLKVTDKRLLEKTGGIIQGMSGSPIIQNGKIIGAVTHVFVSDPSKGFGIYLDWMIDN